MEIRKLIPKDIFRIKDLQPSDWSDVTPYFKFYLEQPHCHAFVLVEQDQIIASGNVSISGTQAWLSHIMVHVEYRGKGRGKAITQFLLRECEKHSCRQVHLIATTMGEPVYAKLGFRSVCRYLFLKTESFICKESPLLQDIVPEDKNQILAMDRSVTAEDRSYLFKEPLKGSIVKRNNKTEGFYLPEVWNGPIISSKTEAGIALLSLHLKEKGFVVLPDRNTAALEFLDNIGASEFHEPGTRMVLGDELSWQPENIYGRIAGAFG